jgi:hypothetical protein
VILLRLEASMVSMNEMAPLYHQPRCY